MVRIKNVKCVRLIFIRKIVDKSIICDRLLLTVYTWSANNPATHGFNLLSQLKTRN